MVVLQHETQDFLTKSSLKAVTTLPKNNDKFFCEETNLIYDYDPNNTDADDGLHVLTLDNFPGRFQAILKKQDIILLPAPKREEYGSEFRNVLTGETVYGPIVQARLPLLDQELIDSGNVYLEYGRLRGLSKSRERIVFWADGNGTYDGTTTGGGTHSNVTVIRLNRIPVTQSRDLMFVLPRELFYKTRPTQYFDANNPTGLAVYDELVCSGSRKRSIRDPFLFPQKPFLQNFKDKYHTVQERYARLIVIEDGNVIAQGDISEPYFTETEKQFTIQTDTMSVTQSSTRGWRINGRIGESHKH